MKIRFLALVTALTLLLAPWVAPVALQAQTSISTTTLGAAVTATATTITVASTANMTAGSGSAGATFLFPLQGAEQMRVMRVISATQVEVMRGVAGVPAAYLTGGTIYFGPGNVFKDVNPPVGTCTATSWAYTPWINISDGTVATCTNSRVMRTEPYTLVTRNPQGFGLSIGAGCSVTQATSKATGATCTGATGEITLNGAALAAATAVQFTLTNVSIAAGDYVLCQHVSGGTAGAYDCTALAAAGSSTVTIKNNTAGSLSEAAVIKFVVIKAATS